MYFMLLDILSILLNILWWIIIVQAVMSWLIAFNVINTHNDFVGQLWHVLDRITEPLYRPFRRIMPDFGGIDLTPMVVLILLIIIQGPVMSYLYRLGVQTGMA
ncbi:YggT family protein [Sphingopyxis sp. PAMC25046]|nr:YggT family protein [Sphingopyxis sp. PAMC25046]